MRKRSGFAYEIAPLRSRLGLPYAFLYTHSGSWSPRGLVADGRAGIFWEMDAVIVSVGAELTTGQCVDTNSAWLSTQLCRSGVRILRHVTVGDEVDTLTAALRRASEDAEMVLVTGGLGPTADDITRGALAAAIREPLEESPEALAQLEAFFARWQKDMDPANRVQAMLPRGCDVIPNACGTAPGIYCRRSGWRLFALPGVPSEMKAMFTSAVEPVIAVLAKGRTTAGAKLLCYGISEAKVGTLLADLMDRARNPLVGTTASDGVIAVRVVARGGNPGDARERLDADAAVIRQRLGRAVFGADDDTLQGAVAKALVGASLTIATAESCTGGLLAKRLTDIPGSSAYFLQGYVTYTNEAKARLLAVPEALIARDGAVSESVASAMAEGCRRSAGSDLALAITGIAGPGGGSPPEKPVGLVYIALADASGVEVKRLLMGEHLSRAQVRDRACKSALNLVRLRVADNDTSVPSSGRP